MGGWDMLGRWEVGGLGMRFGNQGSSVGAVCCFFKTKIGLLVVLFVWGCFLNKSYMIQKM